MKVVTRVCNGNLNGIIQILSAYQPASCKTMNELAEFCKGGNSYHLTDAFKIVLPENLSLVGKDL